MPEFEDAERPAFLFDPIRQKKVLATPEEKVRQAVVHYFLTALEVPARLIAVEFDIRRLAPQAKGRLDVVAFVPGGGGLRAWAIAECKAPDIAIDDKTARQLERYLALVQSRFIMATNGTVTLTLEREGEIGFRRIDSLPKYGGPPL